MTRQFSMTVHVLLLMAQGLSQYVDLVPKQYQGKFTMVLMAAQAALTWIAHNWNADGTPATVAYIPKQ